MFTGLFIFDIIDNQKRINYILNMYKTISLYKKMTGGFSMGNLVIIGSGPAGISSALYALRAGIPTHIISAGGGALKKTNQIDNYYGFESGISGEALYQAGVKQAKALGAEFSEEQVVSVSHEDRFVVVTQAARYCCDAVILATGASRASANIPGLKEHEGSGVSYCAVCDGFFFRGKKVGVLGSGEYALHEAGELLPLAGQVTMLTNGEKPTFTLPDGITVNEKKITRVDGPAKVEGVTFEDGETLALDGLFVAVGIAGSAELAKKMGVLTDKNKILVDERMSTNVDGIFAAGDCTPGILQISKAVYQGTIAGTSAIVFIREKEKN